MTKIYSKVVSTLFVLTFIYGNVFAAGDINIKGGINTGAFVSVEKVKAEYRGVVGSESSNTDVIAAKGLHIGAEFLYPVNDTLKLGAGMLYISASPFINNSDYISFNYLPMYATIQINPFSNGFFFKGNIGFVSMFFINWSDDVDALFSDGTFKGGLYYGFSLGYEMKNGWFWELAYNCIASYFSGYGYYADHFYGGYYYYEDMKYIANADYTYEKIGFSLGYQFKLK